MEQKWHVLFKYLALIARSIGIFPVFIILSYVYSNRYPGEVFKMQLMGLLLVMTVGYVQVSLNGLLGEKLKNKLGLLPIIEGALYIGVVGIITYSIWKYLNIDLLMKVVTNIMYITFYGLSIKAYKQHYMQVIPLELVVAISFIYVMAMACCHYSILGIMYLSVIVSYLFLNNQYKLELLLRRTQANTPMFRSIRKDNMKWICLVMGGIFIVYPFRKQFGEVLWWIWLKVCLVIKVIIHIIVFLTSWISPEQSDRSGVGMGAGMGNMAPAEANELLDFILWLVMTVIVMYIVFKYQKTIIMFLKAQVLKVTVWFRKLYYFLFPDNKRQIANEAYYEDQIEEISDCTILARSKGVFTTKRKWLKQVKKYLKQPANEYGYREGYKLLLQGIKLYGIRFDKAQTPREIMALVLQEKQMPSIQKETMFYEEIRYKEQIATIEEIEALRLLLKGLVDVV